MRFPSLVSYLKWLLNKYPYYRIFWCVGIYANERFRLPLYNDIWWAKTFSNKIFLLSTHNRYDLLSFFSTTNLKVQLEPPLPGTGYLNTTNIRSAIMNHFLKTRATVPSPGNNAPSDQQWTVIGRRHVWSIGIIVIGSVNLGRTIIISGLS